MLILSALSRFHVVCSTQVYDDNGLWNRRSKKLKSALMLLIWIKSTK